MEQRIEFSPPSELQRLGFGEPRIAKSWRRPVRTRFWDVGRTIELNMPSDRPGLIMRRRLLELLRSQGEEEVTRVYA